MLRSPALSIFCTFLVAFLFSLALTPRAALAQSDIPNNVIPIYAIQGRGDATPLLGEWVDTYGVVTGVSDTGFYLQDPVGDDDATTSDGIFVYTRTRPRVEIGACVLVTRGFVDEFYEKTELSRANPPQAVDYCTLTAGAPGGLAAAAIVPPAEPGIDPVERFESLEGMRVRVDDLIGTVQGPTKRFRNGDVEIAFLPDPWPETLPGARVFQAEPEAMQGLMFVSGSLGAVLPELNWGDRIGIGAAPGNEDAVNAVLDYNFGKYQLMLLPGEAVTATVTSEQPRGPLIAPAMDGEFTLCTLNLFGMGRGTEQFPDDASYLQQLTKRARAITESLGGCTVIALQEAGTPKDVENLAALLRQEFDLDYTATAIKGPGTVSVEFPLTNALLTRRDRVEVLNAEVIQGCSLENYNVAPTLRACGPGEYPLFNRPPLAVDLAVDGAWDEPYSLTVIDNHWKSKGGDESINVVRRTAQAAHVAAIVQTRLDADPAARVLVTGDLNDYYQSAPVETLRIGVTPALHHLYDALPPLNRYTYIFNGGSQVLDHMLATPALTADVAAVEPVRVNADYAYPAAVDPTSIHHASDHDPVAITLRPDTAGWVGGNLADADVGVALLDQDDLIVAETTTDAQGDFRLWRVDPGAYTLAFYPSPGLEVLPGSRPLTVDPGESMIVQPLVRRCEDDMTTACTLIGPMWGDRGVVERE